MRIVTFGEIMLRLSPVGYKRFIQADSFDVNFGGAEANVATALARFGIGSTYVTKLPQTPVGDMAVSALAKYGVDVSFIARGGERVGIYYYEKGIGERRSNVVYDRAHSAVSESKRADFDWQSVMQGADWFHITGITAAVVDKEIIRDALEAAKQNGAVISIDYNYRSKLWTRSEMAERMREFMPYADVFIGGDTDANDLLGFNAASPMAELMQKYGIKLAARTVRESISASDNIISAVIYHDGKEYYSKKHSVRIADRVGGGDAFDAGLIYALMNRYDCQKAVEFAIASDCLKHTTEGDMALSTVDEVKELAASTGGDVAR